MTITNCPSPNYGVRRGGAKPSIIVLHYTGMENAQLALERMCDPKSQVSAHYMVDEQGKIFALVGEDKRAWHAGASYWAGEGDINSHSIGIEMVNRGRDPYSNAQVTAVIKLCKDIMSRHKIRHVLAHSDIAPARKIDPDAHFPWARLADEGVGRTINIKPTRQDLLDLGYDPACDADTLIKAFNRHWGSF